MIKLQYNTPIRAAAWGDIWYARTFTVAGYAARNGYDPAAAIARAKENGHDLVGSIYTGTMLIGDRDLAAKRNAEDREIAAAAVTLKTGDEVEIDGAIYTVRFAQRNETSFSPINSDPIHFIPKRDE